MMPGKLSGGYAVISEKSVSSVTRARHSSLQMVASLESKEPSRCSSLTVLAS